MAITNILGLRIRIVSSIQTDFDISGSFVGDANGFSCQAGNLVEWSGDTNSGSTGVPSEYVTILVGHRSKRNVGVLRQPYQSLQEERWSFATTISVGLEDIENATPYDATITVSTVDENDVETPVGISCTVTVHAASGVCPRDFAFFKLTITEEGVLTPQFITETPGNSMS